MLATPNVGQSLNNAFLTQNSAFLGIKKVEFPLPVAVPWLSGLHGLSPQDGVHGPEDGVHGPEDAANGPWPALSVPPGSNLLEINLETKHL